MFRLLNRQNLNTRKNKYKRPSIIEASRFRSAVDEWQFPIKWELEQDKLKNIPICISVGSGKGGVGKTLVSSNLAYSLAQSGYEVLVVDLDLGCSNLHSHFRLKSSKNTLSDYLSKSNFDFDKIIHRTEHPNLQIIPGGNGQKSFLNENSFSKRIESLYQDLMASRSSYGTDIVIFDLGAGVHSYTLDFFLASHLGLLTVLPESTSIENAYTFLKQCMWRMMDNIAEKTDLVEDTEILKSALANSHYGEDSYLDILKNMHPAHPEICQTLYKAMKSRFLGIVMNQIRDHADLSVGVSMSTICRDFFGLNSHYMGGLNYDETVVKALKNRCLVGEQYAHGIFMKKLKKVKDQSVKLLDIRGVGI